MTAAISPLKQHILTRLLLTGGVLSALLLVVFLTAYRSQLIDERSRASLGFNLLLQAALENAMLKRDVQGLTEIVTRLGSQPGIRSVMILDPNGEVRFASAPDTLGRKLPALVPARNAAPTANFHTAESGIKVLRSINPVRNKPPCTACHGDASVHPINGILVVDYDAEDIRTSAWRSALAFAGAGIVVLALIMVVLWRSLSRQVLAPVTALGRASAALENGRLDERIHLGDRVVEGELSELGQRFNRMAARLEEQLARLRAHENHLQYILDSLPDGLRVIRIADMEVVMTNLALRHQLGTEAATSIKCYAQSHGRKEPCADTMVICPVKTLEHAGDMVKCTHLHRGTDGEEFAVEVHAARIDLGEGGEREAYVVESVRDLAQAARISHEQRLSEIGFLAAGVAHEIHNPLGSIRLAVEGLARDIRAGRSTADQTGAYLDSIDSEVDNCINITRRLLLLSRTPSEILQVVDINSVIEDTARLLDYEALTRHVRQTLRLHPAPLQVLADDPELRMMFLNLLQNAQHAMPKGGEATISTRIAEGKAVIVISDTGIGIAPDRISRIFAPFYSARADGSTGTGLGLTIVKGIVERFNGTIRVKSVVGQGTTFTICLPLAETSLEHQW